MKDLQDIVHELKVKGVAHLLIASFFYRMSNRHTWNIIFNRDLAAPGDAALQQTLLVDAVLHYLKPC